MRRFIWLFSGLLLLLPCAAFADAGKAILSNGHAMVPFRPVAEWYGGKLTVDRETHEINYLEEGYTMTMTVGSKAAVVDGRDVTLPTPPIEQDGVIYVPLWLFTQDADVKVTCAAGKLEMTHPDCEKPLTFTAGAQVIKAWQQETRGESVETTTPAAGQAPALPAEKTPAGSEQITPLPSGWELHRHALGFQVKCPKGWQVSAEGTMITLQSEAQKAGILVMPLLLKQPAPAGQIVRNTLARLVGVFPQTKLSQLKQIRKQPDEAACTMTFVQDGVTGQANILCSMRGRCGMFYAIAAPKTQFAALKPTMIGVLKSLTFTATAAASAPASAPAAKLSYVRWQDPNEHAFTAEVPRGWQVSGGLSRRHALDCRQCLRLVSPDKRITVICSDPELHGYMQPLPDFGFPEGAQYPLGAGLINICATYRTGPQYADEYVKTKFGRELQQLTISPPRDRPDASAAMNRGMAEHNLPMQFTTGEVTFNGTHNGTPMRGYCFAGVIFSSLQNGAPYHWSVENLYGYLAPAAQEATAQAVLLHLVKTFRIDPDWQQRQSHLTAAVAAIDRQKNEDIGKMITGAFNERNRVQDTAARNWSNATLGQTDVRDPNTGESWKVASGHNYYWSNGNVIVGTNTYNPPDIDFTPLAEW